MSASSEVLGASTTGDGSELGRELVRLRSRNSRTYEAAPGTLVARVFSESLHYKAADGSWQPIDNRLVKTSGGYRNAANEYRAELPARLNSGSVQVSEGGDSVAFRLRQAKGRATVSGGVARYEDARPGVDAVYTMENDALKEELVLRDRAATRVFTFELSPPAGLTPRLLESGGIELTDAAGAARMALPAPVMFDASRTDVRGVDASLERSGSSWLVHLRPDDEWLDSTQRTWPVTVDPGIYPVPNRDCWVEDEPGADAETSFCSTDYLDVGYGTRGSTSHDHRALLWFDVQEAVPADSEVLYSSLNLWLREQTGTQAKPLTVHRVTRSWTSPGVSWNRHDGISRWGEPGGDHVADALGPSTSVGGSSGVARWYRWNHLRELTERWARGKTSNHGLLLKEFGGTSNNLLVFNASEYGTTAQRPYMDIQYTRRTGDRRGYTFERFELSDRIKLQVNPANGNAMLRQTDVTVPAGLGPDVTVGRTYNSLGGSQLGQPLTPDFGGDWELDTAQDLKIHYGLTGDAFLYGPSAYVVRFGRKTDANGNLTNGYDTPAGFDATLVRNTDGSHALTEHGSQTKYAFDSSGGWGRLSTITDRNGRDIDFIYRADARWKVDRIVDHWGRATQFHYNATTNDVERIVDPAGREHEYVQPTGGGEVTSYSDPNGGVTSYEYTPGDGMTKVTTPAGRVTQIAYYPAGHADDGKVQSVTRVTTSTSDIDPKWEFMYDQDRDGSSKATVRDPMGHDTRYVFDEDARVTSVTNGNDEMTSVEYTANSNVESYTAPSNAGTTPNTTLSYDADGNLEGSSTPAGGGNNITTSTKHGTAGEVPSSVQGYRWLPGKATNAQNRTTTMTYDADGNPKTLASELAAQNQITLNYDPNSRGKLDSITDQRGNTTSYRYDANGNIDKITPPANERGTLLGATEMTYHAQLSRLEKVKNGRGEWTYLEYDNLDRLTKLRYRGAADSSDLSTVQYVYDGDGNLTQEIDSVAGTSTYTYDNLSRLTDESLPGGRSNAYSYDRTGNLTSLTDGGGKVEYGYDAANRNTAIYEPGVSAPIRFSYDSDGQRTRTGYPNGVAIDWSYDQANRLTAIKAEKTASSTVLQHLTYAHADGTGRETALRQSVTDQLAGKKTTYDYDALDRLLQARTSPVSDLTQNHATYAYTYDGASNRTREQITGSQVTNRTRSFAYSRTNQLCWHVSGAVTPDCTASPTGASYPSHDANGNETSNGSGRSLGYNLRDQTTSMAGSATGYLGAGQDRRTSFGGKYRQFNVLGLGIVERTAGGSAWNIARDESGGLASQRSGSDRYYYLFDALGSITGLTDTTGSVVRTHSYEPYGADAGSTGTIDSLFRFAAGHRTDSGLYHYGQRYYDPAHARWTQQDPLNQPADLRQANRYAYVGGDPINLTDRTGTHFARDVLDKADRVADDVKPVVEDAKRLLDLDAKVEEVVQCGEAVLDEDTRFTNRDAYDCSPFDIITGEPENAY